MIRIFLILFILSFCKLCFSQIQVNTPFEVLSNNPHEIKLQMANLSDTATIKFNFKWAGLVSYAVDVNEHWTWDGTKWVKLVNPSNLVAKTDSICIASVQGGIPDTACVFVNSAPLFEQITPTAGSTVTTTIDLNDLIALTDDEIDQELKVYRNGVLLSHNKHYQITSQFVITTLGVNFDDQEHIKIEKRK